MPIGHVRQFYKYEISEDGLTPDFISGQTTSIRKGETFLF